jgi:hypothetical protein
VIEARDMSAYIRPYVAPGSNYPCCKGGGPRFGPAVADAYGPSAWAAYNGYPAPGAGPGAMSPWVAGPQPGDGATIINYQVVPNVPGPIPNTGGYRNPASNPIAAPACSTYQSFPKWTGPGWGSMSQGGQAPAPAVDSTWLTLGIVAAILFMAGGHAK